MSERNTLIGFDPSFATMGIAIYRPDLNHWELHGGDIFDCLQYLARNARLSQSIAIVENPALDSTTFKAWGMVKAEIDALSKYQAWSLTKIGRPPRKVTSADVESQFRIAMNYAQKVGENKAAAKLLIKMLHDKGVPVIEIAPSKRDKAFKYEKQKDPETGQVKKSKVEKDVRFLKMPTKTTAAQFRTLTGYALQSNEHARDAATLLVGRTITWAENQIKIAGAGKGKRPASYPGPGNFNEYIVQSNR